MRLTKCQLLQRPSRGLREHEPDKADLEREPAAVRDEVFPADVADTDGVDEGREEAGATAEELEDCYAAASFGVGEEFDEEG